MAVTGCSELPNNITIAYLDSCMAPEFKACKTEAETQSSSISASSSPAVRRLLEINKKAREKVRMAGGGRGNTCKSSTLATCTPHFITLRVSKVTSYTCFVLRIQSESPPQLQCIAPHRGLTGYTGNAAAAAAAAAQKPRMHATA
eukprot:scaffold74730_cov17-Tisochrysis_lutea.AAC.1